MKAVEAVIPAPVAEGTDAAKFVLGDAHWEWWQDYREKVDISNMMKKRMIIIENLLLQILAKANMIHSIWRIVIIRKCHIKLL